MRFMMFSLRFLSVLVLLGSFPFTWGACGDEVHTGLGWAAKEPLVAVTSMTLLLAALGVAFMARRYRRTLTRAGLEVVAFGVSAGALFIAAGDLVFLDFAPALTVGVTAVITFVVASFVAAAHAAWPHLLRRGVDRELALSSAAAVALTLVSVAYVVIDVGLKDAETGGAASALMLSVGFAGMATAGLWANAWSVLAARAVPALWAVRVRVLGAVAAFIGALLVAMAQPPLALLLCALTFGVAAGGYGLWRARGLASA
jgi:hypothetical protein